VATAVRGSNKKHLWVDSLVIIIIIIIIIIVVVVVDCSSSSSSRGYRRKCSFTLGIAPYPTRKKFSCELQKTLLYVWFI
jgi:hypothetical protein